MPSGHPVRSGPDGRAFSSRPGSPADLSDGGYCCHGRARRCTTPVSGCAGRPFRPTLDLDAYYPAATHEAALHQLKRAIDDDEGLVLLTAEPATGKTLLARRLFEGLDEEVRCVLLTNSHVARKGDLSSRLLRPRPAVPGLDRAGGAARGHRVVPGVYRDGGKTLVVVDEMHDLATDVLEEFRLLSNLEGKDGKAVQVLLVALPEIEAAIEEPALRRSASGLRSGCGWSRSTPTSRPSIVRHQITGRRG